MNPSDYTAFQRNLFTDGTLLTAAGLRLQQEYDSGKRRLINRRFFGWGILSGFALHAEGENLLLEPGFALTPDGRELLLEQPLRIPFGQLDFSAFSPFEHTEQNGILCLEYQEISAGSAMRYSSEMEPLGTIPDRVLESFRLTVQPPHSAPDLSLARCLFSGVSGSFHIRQVIPLSPVFHPAGSRREESSGWLELQLHTRQSSQGVFYSPPIQHELGSGPANIRLAVQGWQNGSPCWVSGEAELFGAPVQTAVKQNPADGSFVIAVRSRDPLLQAIRIQWIAQKIHLPDSDRYDTVPASNTAPPLLSREESIYTAEEPDSPQKANSLPIPLDSPALEQEAPPSNPAPESDPLPSNPKLKVSPEVANLKPGEQVQFCPLLEPPASGPPPAFHFRVRDLDGGSIDAEGIYTAPAHEGFFQIEVFRQNCPRQHAFVYALVRT